MSKSIFKNIDETIEKTISQYRTSAVYEKISEKLRDFSEGEQLIINQVLNVSTFIIPIVLVLTFLVIRSNSLNEIGLKKEIVQKITNIGQSKTQLTKLKRALVSGKVITEKEDFVKEVNKVLTRHNIKISKVTINNFLQNGIGNEVQRIEADINFKEITNLSYANLMLDIQNKFKATIIEADISKNQKTDLLFGKVNISLFSKVQ